MFKINLVPEVQEKKNTVKKMNFYANIGVGAVLGVLVVSILIINGVTIAKKVSLGNTNEEIASLENEIKDYAELEKTVISLEQGLAGIKQITDGANSWTKILPHIEKATPTDAKFTTLKLGTGTIDGNVTAATVDSLAKMIESFKSYQVIVLTGSGDQGAKYNVTLDESQIETVTGKSTNRWNAAVSFDPTVDHEIKVTSEDGKSSTTVKYTAVDKKVSSNDSTVTTEVRSLFSGVDTTAYSKTDKGVTFSIKFSFDEKAIW